MIIADKILNLNNFKKPKNDVNTIKSSGDTKANRGTNQKQYLSKKCFETKILFIPLAFINVLKLL